MIQTDEEIALLVQGGDKEAFALLVDRYENKIARYGRKFLSQKEDIEDMVQEVFVKAYVNIQGFDTERRFSSWIYRIAHNEFVNALKKKSRQPFYFLDLNTDILALHLPAKEKADGESEERMIRLALEESLAGLDLKYREILVLAYLEDLSYQEISDILKIPISTVGVRLKRAKDNLRKIYENKYGKQ